MHELEVFFHVPPTYFQYHVLGQNSVNGGLSSLISVNYCHHDFNKITENYREFVT